MPQPLKILMANWAWHPTAGEWTYIDNLKTLYENHGHEVIPFSMKSSGNYETNGFDQYFIDYINYQELNKKNLINGVRALSKSIYSLEAKKKLQQLLLHHKVDIAHLHDINHYLTPSILPVLKRHKIPIIWTLHDYTLLCPEGSFISNLKICENCKGGAFYHCALQKCKKGSLLASSLAAIENTVHSHFNVFRYVDYFLCPSEFLFNKFKEFNFHTEKLVLTNLCCEIQHAAIKKKSEKYILYVGRLVKVKGLLTLLKAIAGLDVKLYIAGNGAEAANLNKYITANQLANVELLGYKSKKEVYELVQNAEILICPSEWYENFPYSIIEAMLLKTPVIASNIGGIPELVINQKTGLLFEPFNHLELRTKIICLLNDSRLQQQLTENAYARTLSIVNYQHHYSILKKIYSNVCLDL